VSGAALDVTSGKSFRLSTALTQSGAVIETDRPAGSFTAPLSSAQQRLWMLDRLAPGSTAYNVPRTLRLRGPLDVRALRESIVAIVRRHEMLRTHFALAGDEPVQVVMASIDVPFAIVDLLDAGGDAERLARERAIDEAERSFDLASGPLLRVTLFRIGDADHVLLVAMHHIVTDEWSSAIFDRELAAGYTRARGGAATLVELPIQYADYAAWERASFEGPDLARQSAYWLARLAGAPVRTELPVDEAGLPADDAGATQSRLISPATARLLRELGAAHGATPFMTFLAAFDLLLYRYTGQTDLVVGSPIAHRDREEVEDLIGFFLNTLALRTQIDPDESFGALVARVRAGALEAFAHGDLPFERVVASLNLARPGGTTPLINVFFQIDSKERSPLGFDGLTTQPFPLPIATAKFDLSLSLLDSADGLQCTLQYRTGLFAADRIARMLESFEVLLESIAAMPDAPVATLELSSADERRRMLVDFNDTAVAYPRDATLLDLLEEPRLARAAETALEWQTEDGALATLDYATLHARADDRAERLRALGVGPNVGVGICQQRNAELVISVLAVLKAGGYYVPLDPEYPAERLAFMLEDSGVRVLATESGSLPALSANAPAVIAVDEPAERGAWQGRARDVTPQRPAAADLAYMIYTSGTSGRPKGALNRHAGIVNRLRWMRDRYALRPEDVVLHKTSFSFDISVWELLLPLIAGSRLVLARPGGQRDPAYLIDLIARRGVTVAHFVPSMLRLFVAAGDLDRCGSLRHVICSGEALPGDLVTALYERLAADVHNLYGPTEAAIDVTHFTCPRDWNRSSVPIGRPVANTQIYLLDPRGRPVPLGARGELHIGGVQVGAGYHGRPELTAERFIPDPFGPDPAARLYKTGDLASFDADGTIQFHGRLDSQVKLNGFRIELGEIESTIRREPGVRDAVVVMRGEAAEARLIAYVVTDDERRSPDAWRRLLAATLPAFMVPTVVRIPRLPLTPNGKLDRAALPAAERPAHAAVDDHHNMLYHELIGIWEHVLGVAPIGAHDNFFMLGGQSLLAVRLIAAVSQTFGKPFPATRFFAGPTVAQMASVLVEGMDADTGSPLVAMQTSGTKVPLFFIDGDLHGGGHYVRSLARGLGDDQPLYALHMPGTNGRPFPRSIEEMALDYAALIEGVRPHGPYALGGFCSGALIAYEIARLFQAKGERVDKLIFVESGAMNGKLTRIAGVVDALLGVLRVDAARRSIARNAVARIANRVRQATREPLRFRTMPARYVPRFVDALRRRTRVDVGVTIRARWDDRTMHYIPKRFRGSVTVLLARDAERPGRIRETNWASVVDHVDTFAIPGSHLTCITRHIDSTAAQIRECLRRKA